MTNSGSWIVPYKERINSVYEVQFLIGGEMIVLAIKTR